jgi:hypothetical protein
MSQGATFWYYVICTALATYFGLAFVIAIGGFFDVKRMFRRLNESHKAATSALPPHSSPDAGDSTTHRE